MVLMVVGAPCYYTWSLARSKIISRIEGHYSTDRARSASTSECLIPPASRPVC